MLKTQHYHLLVFFLFFSIIPSPAQTDSKWYPVSKIIDGDTFWIINANGQEEKIRLIGVDAPESRKSGKKEIGYYGKESKAYLTQILTGNKVRLEYDVSKYDRYKRTLAYVYLENGTFLNAFLIKNGYASVMTVPPNVKYADLFVKLQKEARDKKKGLWK
ncbi:thermonuclease family protein [Aquiflexum gelatinilyticum]|uniref:thermonuclease family protein n=1 Tax=Aquiflexum gelatinilyticum TaxID=2961943 RepID=UPI002168FE65|nr:thermonuclease family protein [Aquiflexum gelatinilyticum]MCS4433461.1 thermonuclease family protein [Aquiflexum gelatinilyticum]